jgi:hypothetical protein
MTRTLVSFCSFLAVAVVLGLGLRLAHADAAGDRATIGDAAIKLASSADSLARTAKASQDRAVRKKFAPRASELGDDLQAFARRTSKDIALETLAKDTLAIAKDAADLIELADEAEDKDERKALRATAQLIDQGISALRRTVETMAARQADARKAPASPARPAAMSPGSFGQLIEAIKDASFDKDKVEVARQAAGANWFTSNQVAGVMGVIDFDDSRVEAAVAMWSHIVDPENSFVVFKKLDFDSSKDKLRKRVGK